MPQEVTSAKQGSVHGGGKGMISRTVAPQSRPHHPAPPKPRCGARGGRAAGQVPAMSFGASFKGFTSPVGSQAWKVPPNSQGGECSEHWAQHPLPGSALPRARGSGAGRAARAARLELGGTASPAPWFVPSMSALSNFNVGKYLPKNRRFVKFLKKKKKFFLEYFQTCVQKRLKQTRRW